MKLKRLAILSSFVIVYTSTAIAKDNMFTPRNVSTKIGLGTMSGKTKERLYDPDTGHKDSQLDWKYKNAVIIKGDLDWDLMPWISIGVAGWTTIGSRGGHMTDTDWFDINKNEWTDQSKHPNTRLNYANEFDLNIKGWLLKEPDYHLGVMAGYQESRYSFHARGGSKNYTDEETGNHIIGTFPPNQKSIGYKQYYKIPYIGLVGGYRYSNLEFSAAVKYSGWVHTSDNDEHYLSEITFRSKVRDQNYYSLTGNIGYHLTPNVKMHIEGIWNRTTNKKGYTHLNDYREGYTDGAKNSSGIESYNFITTVGLKYSF